MGVDVSVGGRTLVDLSWEKAWRARGDGGHGRRAPGVQVPLRAGGRQLPPKGTSPALARPRLGFSALSLLGQLSALQALAAYTSPLSFPPLSPLLSPFFFPPRVSLPPPSLPPLPVSPPEGAGRGWRWISSKAPPVAGGRGSVRSITFTPCASCRERLVGRGTGNPSSGALLRLYTTCRSFLKVGGRH